ncbi:type I polyketide synthase [Actinokineospora iranica]|uniref:Polyketide-type polyunsaturated fatty acid synthase PfaA n=1 Tax=Actinokineospora iranica TaxID=1271860 RepID=A0A1G6TZ40_9PSEU|nr:type I polyketide synthase [Actinokineospora iranica]SDD34331.1 polyketide-type polyunsaturated fatty acid synthase PfaA [Actinokineospora iranica]
MSEQHELSDRRLARNPIAIVGMSGLFPMARDHREYWQNIVDGLDCTEDVPASRWSLDDYYDADPAAPDKTYSRRGAFLPDVDFDPVEFGLPPNQLDVTSTMQTLSLGVARDLLRDAGAGPDGWYDASRTGVVLGTTGPVPLMHPLAARLSTPVLKEVVQSCGLSTEDADAIAEKYVKAFAPWEENSFPGLLANVVAGRVANRLGLGGMNSTVDAACAASLSAIRTAVAELVDGRADMMITGGVDTENSIFIYLCFSKVGALSRSGRISPFADNADGTLLGEGIGMLALRRLSDAVRDGNRIYAVIRGIGSSSDGRSKSIYAPRAEGQRVAIERAYADAECSPASVELFEAHATGTAVGDRTELTALGDVLRAASDERHFAALGSVKSQIGHTKGAAGTASLMKLALGLYHKVLPPTINVDRPNSAVDFSAAPYYVNTETRPWIRDPHRPVRRAAASAMGFGGTNFHVVLEEHDPDRAPVRTLHRTARAHLWHAPDPAALLAALRAGEPSVDGGEIPDEHARIGFVAHGQDLPAALAALRELAVERLAAAPDADEWAHPRGVFYRRRAKTDLKIGALFAGQGSQYLGMGLEAVLNNPVVGTAFDEANAAFDGAPTRLAPVVFPPPTFDAEQRQAQEAALRRTEHAQPAIGALAAGQFRYLRGLGLDCAGYLGHSFGELTALWAAGSLSDADFFRLARARGEAMAPAEGTDDPGSMAAITASREDVERLLADVDGVVICNHNAPDQVVVGGPTDAVGQVVRLCADRGLTARVLPVAAAFHTSHVAHAVEAFGQTVASVRVGEPTAPVYANSPEAGYGADPEANAQTLTNQLLRPVEFVAGLHAMRDAGCTVFVEFGPKQILTSLVGRTLGDEVVAIPTDAGPLGDSDVALKQAVVRLAVLGVPLSAANATDAPVAERQKPSGMSIPLSAPEYVSPARREAYRTALTDGYRVTLAHPATNGAPAAVGAPPTSNGTSMTAPSSLPTTPAPGSSPAASAPAASAAGFSPAVPTSAAPTSGLSPAASVPAAATSGLSSAVSASAAPTTGLSPAASATTGFAATGAPTSAATGASPVAGGASTALAVNGGTSVTAHSASATNGAAGASTAPNGLSTMPPSAPAPHHPVTAHGHASTPAAHPGVGAALRQHIAIHSEYLETQLRVAGTLADAVRHGDVDLHLADAVTAVKDQSVAIGQAHTRANEILAALTEIELTGATSFPTIQRPSVEAELQALVDEPAHSLPPAIPTPPQLPPTPTRSASSHSAQPPTTATNPPSPTPAHPAQPPTTATSPAPPTPAHPAPPTTSAQSAPPHTASSATPHLTPAATPAPFTVDSASIRTALREVVADKTGYPVEMVDPSMDLEADLGVDSIKRVQVLGVVQERFPSLPDIGPEQLGELRTLDQIADFLSAAAPAASAPAASNAPTADIRLVLREVVAEKTGYPVEMVDPSMDLEADLGVDSIKRVQVLGVVQERFPSLPNIGPEQLGELRTLDQIADFLSAAAPAAPAPAANGAPTADIRVVLREVVAEKTGYPVEMVDPSMDLEADLGVDSIKRVQVLGVVQERFPSLPNIGPEQLGELRTLDQIADFLSNAAPAAPQAAAPTTSDVRTVLISVVSEKTGYPVEMVDPSMDLEADLGVDSIKRVQVLGVVQERFPSLPSIGPEQLGELRTLDQIADYLESAGGVAPKAPEAGATAPRHRVGLVALPSIDLTDAPYAAEPVALVVGRGGADGDAVVAGLESRGWTVRRAAKVDAAQDGRLDLCLVLCDADPDWAVAAARLAEPILLAKHVIPPLNATTAAGTRAAFVTVTRVDGALGLSGRRSMAESLIGGVGGVVKTLAAEAPSLFCRAVDVDPGLDGAAFADAVLAELHDGARDTLEVGVDADGRRTLTPSRHAPAAEKSTVDTSAPVPAVSVTEDDLLVVTGGARGVTALCVRALARQAAAGFLLLGRTELADEPDWARGVADADLKPAVIAGLRSTGAKVTPRDVERAYQTVLGQREIRATLAELGGRATYLAVDVTDADAVRAALGEYRDRVTGVVHGAGVLADALLPDKTAAQVDRVFGAKLGGLRAVLDALDGTPLRHLVLFTSVAGLLGNPGQADYAAANEALCRVAAAWQAANPGRHVTAIDWGAWDGGMVTAELRELFSARGVPLLDPEAGARAFVEQFDPRRAAETCVLIGADVSLAGNATVAAPAFTARRELGALAEDPVIQAHRIGAHPVLPATFGLGWLINVLERAHPGLRVVEVRDYQVHKGIIFDGTPRDGLRVETEPSTVDGDRLVVAAAVRSDSGGALPTSHYAATFVLAPAPAEAPTARAHRFGAGPEDGLEIYREATQFHGPRLQGMRRVLESGEHGMVLECALADAAVAGGAFAGALHSPVLADVLLQGPPVLGKRLLGAACLPLGIGRAEYFAPLPDGEPFALVLDDVRRTGGGLTVTATACDGAGRVLQRFAEVAVVSTPDMTAKFREAVAGWLDRPAPALEETSTR